MFENIKKLKIIDASSVLAGPMATMFFAELGAKVIKFENKKTGGDVTRTWKTANEKPSEISSYYAAVNFGKEIVLLNYDDEQDRKLLFDELKTADILISNFRKKEKDKWGFHKENLHAINPKLIIGNITGFGPESARPAYDLVLQAESGIMSMNGTKESGPLKMPIAFIDVLTGHQIKEAVLCALYEREQTGLGKALEVSLYDTAVCSLVNQASNYLNSNTIPELSGSLHPNIAPYGESFTTKDNKRLVLGVGNEKQFSGFCRVIDQPELLENNKFSTNAARVQNRLELYHLIAPAIQEYTAKEMVDNFEKYGVPGAVIKNLEEVFQDNPHLILETQGYRISKTVAFKLA